MGRRSPTMVSVHIQLKPEDKELVRQMAEMYDVPVSTFMVAVTLGACRGVTRSLEAQVHAGLADLPSAMTRRSARRTRHDEWFRTVPGQYTLDGWTLRKDPERLKDNRATWHLRRPDGTVEDTGQRKRIDAMAYAVAAMDAAWRSKGDQR